MDDTNIIELYWERNESAIAETAYKYGKKLGQLGQRILESREDAEECVNDAYLRAWNSIPPARPDHLFAYLAKITRNLALNVLEKKRADKRRGIVVELSKELEQCLSDRDELERIGDSEEIGEAINGFLGMQPALMRRVFIRRYWYMDSVREIAFLYGIKESRVKSILFRMRGGLRKYLEKEGITI